MTNGSGVFSGNRVIPAGLFAAFVLVSVFVVYTASSWFPKPEVAELSHVSWTLPQYENYFTNLAKAKGAAYAFAVLNNSHFAPGIDPHQIGHDVGYVFYAQKGISGLSECVHNIGDACIHALVTEEFLKTGTDALHTMADFCATFSQNSVTYANCFHGIGHGILAYLKYDYRKAVPECERVYDFVRAKDPNALLRDVYGECVGGLTMELLQGKHDPVAYSLMKPIYLPENDPLSPCDTSFVPAEVRVSCYLYLNVHLVGLAGARANGDFPKDEVYRKALSYCEPIAELDNKRTCYGGVGVSFLYAVNDGDIRKFGHMSDMAMRDVQHWCTLAKDEDSASACILTAAEILLGSGEHGVRPAVQFCSLSGPVFKERCFADILKQGERYLPFLMLNSMCALLPEPHRASCYAYHEMDL